MWLKFKNYAVVFAPWSWALFSTYLIFFKPELSWKGADPKEFLLVFIAPFGFGYLGFDHLNKEKGQAKLSILTCWLGGVGLLTAGMGAGSLMEAISGIKLADVLLTIFGIVHIALALWCYENEGDQIIDLSAPNDHDDS